MKRFKNHHFNALFGYLSLTIILTWPLILNFTTGVIGLGDEKIYLWNFWWFKKALFELHANPFFCDYIFYPFGANIVFLPLTIFNDVVSLFLLPFCSYAAVYNIILFLSFTLSGYGMYLLADYLLKDKKAAFIAGIIFAFCPQKFGHILGHLNLLSTEWIPFYILFLVQMSCGKYSVKNSLLAGVFLLLVELSDFYLLNFVVIFTVIYWCYILISDEKLLFNKQFLKNLIVFSGVFLIGTLPVLVSIFNDIVYNSYSFNSIKIYSDFSSDLAAFFTPSYFNPFLKYQLSSLYIHVFSGGPAENNIFIGYTVILLVLYGLVKYRGRNYREMKLWFYCAVSLFILSMGPYLMVFGERTALPLPGYLMVKLPVFSGMRCLSRMTVMAMLSLSVFAAWVCSLMANDARTPLKKNFVYLLIGILIIIEYYPAPFNVNKITIPEIYNRIALDKGDFTVLEIPLDWYIVGTPFSSRSAHRSQFNQMFHNKRILAGCISRANPYMVDHYLEMPFINKIYRLQSPVSITKFPEEPDAENIINTLKFLNIRYIIINVPFINTPVQRFIEKGLPVKIEKVYEKDGIAAYKVPEISDKVKEDIRYFNDTGKIVDYKYGWSPAESWDSQFKMHWSAGSNSYLSVFIEKSSVDTRIQMKLTPFPFGTTKQTIKIFINGKLLLEQGLESGWKDYSIKVPAGYWIKGENLIRFHYKFTKSPRSVYPGTRDNRQLAAALGYFRVKYEQK